MSATDIHRTIETVWRAESARLVAVTMRLVRDIGTAEELAQEALLAALQQWPAGGIPENPAAWLMSAARRRAIDCIRHEKMARRKHELIGYELRDDTPPDLDADLDDEVGDEVLRLIFTTCHPLLPREAQSALTLRLLGGLTTAEIARAFLLPEATIAQRIVRAKRTLVTHQVPFEVPRGAALQQRLAVVLEVIYLIFNEGYTATAGDDWMRPALCDDARRLGRVLCELAPEQAEVHALAALMDIQASRAAARVGADGEPILLLDQDRTRWDPLLIRSGLQSLEQAEQLSTPRGPYTVQAAIAACHARADMADQTDWPRIAQLYQELAEIAPSPVVELNRAVAVAMAAGPAAGLQLVDPLLDVPALRNYHLLPSVRGDLLQKLHRHAEAREEFLRAAALARNNRERALLLERASQCEKPPES